MLTYLVLDVIMLSLIIVLLYVWPQRLSYRRIVALAIVLCVMTAVFDSLLIHEHIFTYSPSKILGVYAIKAPIEDFSYAIAVALFVPFLWRFYDKRSR